MYPRCKYVCMSWRCYERKGTFGMIFTLFRLCGLMLMAGIFAPDPVLTMRSSENVRSGSQFAFLDRFLFAKKNGKASISIKMGLTRVDRANSTWPIMTLYSDMTSRAFIRSNKISCMERLGKLRPEFPAEGFNSQELRIAQGKIMGKMRATYFDLKPSQLYSKHNSVFKCSAKFIGIEFSYTYLSCEGEININKLCSDSKECSRPREFYIGIADCTSGFGLDFDYKIHFLNTDFEDLQEFDFDERGVYKVIIVFLSIYCAVLIISHCNILWLNWKKRLVHFTLRLHYYSLLLWIIRLAILLGCYISYKNTGYRNFSALHIAQIFQLLSETLFLTLLLLLAVGLTVTRAKLSTWKISLLSVLLTIWVCCYSYALSESNVTYEANRLIRHHYEGESGTLIAALRLTYGVIFSSICFIHGHSHKEFLKFYYIFGALFFFWFFSLSLIVFLSDGYLERWWILTIIEIVDNLVMLGGFSIFLALNMFFRDKNSFFPHQKNLGQVGLENSETFSETNMDELKSYCMARDNVNMLGAGPDLD